MDRVESCDSSVERERPVSDRIDDRRFSLSLGSGRKGVHFGLAERERIAIPLEIGH